MKPLSGQAGRIAFYQAPALALARRPTVELNPISTRSHRTASLTGITLPDLAKNLRIGKWTRLAGSPAGNKGKSKPQEECDGRRE